MAFELGLFLGCCEFEGTGHATKSCLILDRKRWGYPLSDLSGVVTFKGKTRKLVGDRNRSSPPGRAALSSSNNTRDSKRSFRVYRRAKLVISELSFKGHLAWAPFQSFFWFFNMGNLLLAESPPK
jgi:hypothetical protein